MVPTAWTAPPIFSGFAHDPRRLISDSVVRGSCEVQISEVELYIFAGEEPAAFSFGRGAAFYSRGSRHHVGNRTVFNRRPQKGIFSHSLQLGQQERKSVRKSAAGDCSAFRTQEEKVEGLVSLGVSLPGAACAGDLAGP